MTAGFTAQLLGPRTRVGRHRHFEILAVCTANLCRSPDIEAQLRADLAALPGAWTVASAGVRAREGLQVHPQTAQAMAERGLTLPGEWRSRLLRPELVERADLVLTATREHRGAAVALAPTAAGRIFTLRQFARLLSNATAGGPVDTEQHSGDVLVRAAVGARGLSVPTRPDDDDLADPIGGPFPAYRRTAEDIAAATAVISAAIRLPH